MVSSTWEKVGVIGVDAGLCWIGDPCYIIGDDASEGMHSWGEFCRELESGEVIGAMQWNYSLGHPGLGVSVSTGYGDGVYPVYVKRSRGRRIKEVKVVFIEDNDEE